MSDGPGEVWEFYFSSVKASSAHVSFSGKRSDEFVGCGVTLRSQEEIINSISDRKKTLGEVFRDDLSDDISQQLTKAFEFIAARA